MALLNIVMNKRIHTEMTLLCDSSCMKQEQAKLSMVVEAVGHHPCRKGTEGEGEIWAVWVIMK